LEVLRKKGGEMMGLKLTEKEKAEITDKCQKCRHFEVEKIRGINPMSTLQIGQCSIHGEVHNLDYSEFDIKFDSRACGEFKQK